MRICMDGMEQIMKRYVIALATLGFRPYPLNGESPIFQDPLG